jgi:Zn-dependent protease with chaperone function
MNYGLRKYKRNTNTFALPNGNIVIFDDLIKLDNDKELRDIIGVSAHEIIHVVRTVQNY